jgi:hypothetical protein
VEGRVVIAKPDLEGSLLEKMDWIVTPEEGEFTRASF